LTESTIAEFPGLHLHAELEGYKEHGDPLVLFTAIYGLIRPMPGEVAASAVDKHAALVELLERDEEKRRLVRQAFAEIVSTRRMVSFLADSGILPPTGFFTELMRIASHRLLPEIPDPDEFRDCLQIMLHRKDDWVWLSTIPAENSLRFWTLVTPDDELGPAEKLKVFDQFIEAMLVLAYRISGLDLDQDFRRLGDSFSGYSAAFRAVAGEAQRYADAWRRAEEAGETPHEDERHLLVLIDQCQKVVDKAHRAAMRVGTSLSLTFALRRATQSLQRLERIVTLLGAYWREDARSDAVSHWTALVRETAYAENQRNSLRRHVARGMSLLALRVTDNAAKSGEHYITETRSAYFGMWRSAMGAGIIIALLALLKIFASKLDLALIGYAFFYSMIYGLGFMLIYMLHLTIATKQPAMTAQTIAGYLGEAERGKPQQLERLADLVAAVTRSQIAAIIGNVAIALPTAMLVAIAWEYFHGVPMIDVGKGAHLLDDLDIIGWALPHAAIAGVFLFFSGVITGYFDNLSSYARIGERVARLGWLNRLVGTGKAGGIGRYVDAHLGGISGNFLFGCMLGSAGTIGIILGLPIDIRHIAFASANLGYALTAFGFDLPWTTLAWASLGVALIGFVNLSVSFSLALWMALRARDVAFTQTRGLLRTLWLRLRTAPRSFIAVPADAPAEVVAEHEADKAA
jgi:site-specific recombinase